MADERREKARVLLAANLEQAYLTGFLTFQDIVTHVKDYLTPGLVALTKLHQGNAIWPFYARWRGDKRGNITLFMQAFIGPQRFFDELLGGINEGDLPKILEEMIDGKVITWDNLVSAFPYPKLLACMREGLQRAESAVPPVEEEVVEEEVMEVGPSDEPADK